MTIQYSSDTKRAYEDFLKQYDADKSGVSDWTEYLTGLQQSVKDTSTEYQKSAYNDITQAYRNYFIQSSNLAGKGLASGLKESLGKDLYSSYQGTKANVENTAANKITSLLENYSKTVGEAETKMSEKASTLTTLTEAALDWYEQVGKDKKVLDDKLQETNEYRYQDLIDMYNAGDGDLWQNVSTDVYNPSYTLSNLGHAVIDTALADENFAEYLKNYSDKEDLRDLYIENKGLLQEALSVGKKPEAYNNLVKTTKADENVPWNTTQLTYADEKDAENALKNIKSVEYQRQGLSVFDPDRSRRPIKVNGNDYHYNYSDPSVSQTDEVYTKYLKYIKPAQGGVYDVNGTYYAYEDGQWFKMYKGAAPEQSSANFVPVTSI